MDNVITPHTYPNARRPLLIDEQIIIATAWAIKDPSCPVSVVERAAGDMADALEDATPANGRKVWLVPVPSHTGDTSANARLARAIARELAAHGIAAEVTDSLKSEPRQSQCLLHLHGQRGQEAGQLRISRKYEGRDTREPLFFIDNVSTSGATIVACRAACCGFGRGLVYAASGK